MALVSEGMGLKEANTASVFVRELATLLAKALGNRKRSKYMDEHMRGAKAILKYIKNGGEVKMQMIDTEDAELFAKILKNQRVPYVIAGEKDGKTVFVTRACDDKKLEQAWNIYADEIKVGFKEMTPHEFLNTHAEQEVCQAKGFSEIELEVFRKEAAAVGFNYAVVGNEDVKGKYDILYSKGDAANMTQAMKATAYEMSGADGKEYINELQKSLDMKKDIIARTKNKETIYLINQDDSSKFAIIENGVLTEHNLSIEEKTGRDGNKKQVVKDKTKRIYPFGNRELTKTMRSYGKCAEVSAETMRFIDGFDSAGGVVVKDPDKIQAAFESVADAAKKSGKVYNAYVGRKGNADFDKILTLTDINNNDLLEVTRGLQAAGIDYLTVGGDLVYKEKDKSTVDSVLKDTLYNDKFFEQAFEDKCYYEGRAPEGFRLESIKSPVYIMSVYNPSYVVRLDKKGLTVLDHGKEQLSIPVDAPDFAEKRNALLQSMDGIAIVTEKELSETPDRAALIESRAAVKDNEASKQYYKIYKQKKEEFIRSDVNDMNPADREIAKTYLEHDIKITYVDRTFMEKITDMDFGKKMQETRETRTRSTDIDM